MNDSSNAKKFLKEALRQDTKQELWTKAFAYLYLARVAFSEQDFVLAKNYITRLLELKDFDFENSVKSQAKNLQVRIDNNF
jgi:hypothetical protein